MREKVIKCVEYLRTVDSGINTKKDHLDRDERFMAWHKAAYEDKGFLDYDDYSAHALSCADKPVEALTLAETRARITLVLRTARGSYTFLDGPISDGSLRCLLEHYLALTATGREAIASGIYGTAIADAVGVPAEFASRSALRIHRITKMTGGGAHRQEAGTWSDDTSMALCLAFSVSEKNGVDADDIMRRFCDWRDHGAYSPHGECFDIGMTVEHALCRYAAGVPASECGGTALSDNGNGSLMRILPLAYILMAQYGDDLSMHDDAMACIDLVSSLTHRHPISRIACGLYIHIAIRLLLGDTIADATQHGIDAALGWYSAHAGYEEGLNCWERLRDVNTFRALPEDAIQSGGYVVDTLEAALWCLLNTNSYQDCVLKAVNLGSDTDTVAAVAGGLAGIHYGLSGIPDAWRDGLQNKKLLDEGCDKLAAFTNQHK